MIKTKSDYDLYLKCDAVVSGRGEKLSWIMSILNDPIWVFMKLLREYEYRINVKPIGISRLWAGPLRYLCGYRFRRISLKLGFSIPPNVFGPGLHIPHYGTIVVNQNARVGKLCVLHTCVCIAGSEPKNIGDAVYFSTGAIVSGKICLGDNTIIAGNTFVNKNFPGGSVLLAGSPATAIKTTLPWYMKNEDAYQDRVRAVNDLLSGVRCV